jgi:hypothetical protein
VSVGLQGQAEGTCQAKISDLEELTSLVDEEVAGLQVAMHDASFVTVEQAH